MHLAEELHLYTYDDYINLPNDMRYQILQGELVMSPAPSLLHQDISRNLELLLMLYIKQKKNGILYNAPVDVILDPSNIVQPDLVFILQANKSILQKNGIFGAPDLIVEIFSPSTLSIDRYQKKDLYEKFGVKEYWMIDPANQTIEILTLENQKYKLFKIFSVGEKLSSKLFSDFTCDTHEIFESEVK